MSKKVTIHWGDQDLRDLQYLSNLYDLGQLDKGFGTIPKVAKQSITFTIAMVEWWEKVIPDLNDEELDFFFSSIKKQRARRKKLEKAQKLEKEAEK